MSPQIDRSSLHAFYRLCLIQTCQTILSCIFAHISRTRIRYKSASTPNPPPLSLYFKGTRAWEFFQIFIYLQPSFCLNLYVHIIFNIHPQILLCRRMLGFEPRLLGDRVYAEWLSSSNISTNSDSKNFILPGLWVLYFSLFSRACVPLLITPRNYS